jgi:hypothetical protein
LLSLPFNQIPQDGDFISNPFYVATHRGNLNIRLDINPDTAPTLYAMRLASLLFGIAGVIAVYLGARLTISPSAALLAAALTAFQPMYLFMSAVATNDLAVTGMSAIVLLCSTYLIVRKQKSSRSQQNAPEHSMGYHSCLRWMVRSSDPDLYVSQRSICTPDGSDVTLTFTVALQRSPDQLWGHCVNKGRLRGALTRLLIRLTTDEASVRLAPIACR